MIDQIKILISFFLLFMLNFNIYSQNEESIIAEIGNEEITEREFRLRYELSPFLSLQSSWNFDSLKYDFLYSLIAEKLWAAQAEELGLTDHPDFKFYFKPLEEIFVRDALFKDKIESRVILTNEDISNGILKSHTTLKVKIVSSIDSSLIKDFYNKLLVSKNIDSLLITYNYIKPKTQLMEVTLGELKDEEFENLLFDLEVSQFTMPVNSEIGWAIFYVYDKMQKIIDLNDEKIISDVKTKMRARRTMVIYEEYLKNLLSGITIIPNEDLFYSVSAEITKSLSSKRPQRTESGYFYLLDDNDFRVIQSNLSEIKLNETLFSVYDKNITALDFLAYLAFNDFGAEMIDSVFIVKKLDKTLKSFIEKQLLTYEGYRKGLEKTPEVKNDLSMWKKNYLAQLLKISFLDSVKTTDEEVYHYFVNEFVKDSNIVLLNLQIISLNNLDEIAFILEQLEQLKSFDNIVLDLGKTDPLTNDNGETGLQPFLALDDLGLIASTLKQDQIYGPIKRNNKFTLFRVKEKKQSEDILNYPFESMKGGLKNQLRTIRLNDIVNRKTLEYASNKNIKINNAVFKNITTSEIHMFTHRLMGFGGRIAAVPLTDNWTDWINLYEFKKLLLP
jgi:hypothetical protein